MGRRNKGLLAEVIDAPWWVGIGAAVFVFVGLKFILPAVMGAGAMAQSIARGFSSLATLFAIPFLIAAFVSAVRQFLNRRRFDKQSSIDSIRALTWQQFEQLVGEAFRRQGYTVEEVGGGGADGGVDLLLFKSGRKTVVQCKRWQTRQVGVTFVRELYGVMVAEDANDAIFVSSGDYTDNASEFAKGKPIQLIDGGRLLTMIHAVQESPVNRHSSLVTSVSIEAPLCPKCARPMVKRTARSRANAGNQFWGCPTYPQCRGTRSLS